MTYPNKEHRPTAQEIIERFQIPETKLGKVSQERPTKEQHDRAVEKFQRKWTAALLDAWEAATGVRLRKESRKFLIESMIAHAKLAAEKPYPTR